MIIIIIAIIIIIIIIIIFIIFIIIFNWHLVLTMKGSLSLTHEDLLCHTLACLGRHKSTCIILRGVKRQGSFHGKEPLKNLISLTAQMSFQDMEALKCLIILAYFWR